MKPRSLSFALTLLLLLGFGALLLLYPQESAEAARDGLLLCFRLILPSLFPFFVLSSLLVSLGFAALLGRCLKGLMRPLFRLSPSCASALVLGAVGGYPLGARITAQLRESGQCSGADALRLSAFCNNCGPAFLFSVAGWGIFSSKTAGVLLLGTHLSAALFVGLLFRFYPISEKENSIPPTKVQQQGFSAVFPDCVRDSFSATLNVCAFVVLFSVILRLASCSGLLPYAASLLSGLLPTCFSPALCESLLLGLFELSCGISSLAELCQNPAALPLAAFMLAWGGFSVHCQSLPFLHRCVSSLRPYFLGKLLQGLFAALLTGLIAPFVLPNATAVLLPLEPLLPQNLAFSLFHQEILALWVLSGVFSLFLPKKALVKWHGLPYNKKKH